MDIIQNFKGYLVLNLENEIFYIFRNIVLKEDVFTFQDFNVQNSHGKNKFVFTISNLYEDLLFHQIESLEDRFSIRKSKYSHVLLSNDENNNQLLMDYRNNGNMLNTNEEYRDGQIKINNSVIPEQNLQSHDSSEHLGNLHYNSSQNMFNSIINREVSIDGQHTEVDGTGNNETLNTPVQSQMVLSTSPEQNNIHQNPEIHTNSTYEVG